MKKTGVYSAALLALFVSLSFYPKPKPAADPAAGYMMVVLRTGVNAALVIISAAGEATETHFDRKDKTPYAQQAQLVRKLNELRRQGWTVVQMRTTESVVPNVNYPLLSPDVYASQTFLLEKE